MKKRNETKLGLDKLRITKLENPIFIVGGKGLLQATRPPEPDAESPSRGETRTAGEKRYRSDGDCP